MEFMQVICSSFCKNHLFSPSTGEYYEYKSTYSQKLTLVLRLISEAVLPKNNFISL